ncbi:MAG: hypothetical protein K2P14_00680, partial [Anaeroplasmataceae bacterium]|nr:hypothetical protein [Anaeroplasmataceae bacterium]
MYASLCLSILIQIEICNYNTFEMMEWRYLILEAVIIFLSFIVMDLIFNNSLLVSYILIVFY